MTLQRLTQPTRYSKGPGRMTKEGRLLQAAAYVIVVTAAVLLASTFGYVLGLAWNGLRSWAGLL